MSPQQTPSVTCHRTWKKALTLPSHPRALYHLSPAFSPASQLLKHAMASNSALPPPVLGTLEEIQRKEDEPSTPPWAAVKGNIQGRGHLTSTLSP